jgi:predicted RNA-binding Zn ribbon-like protein
LSNRVPDLPLLGEPLLAEFANTLYVDATTRLDVLDSPSWTGEWLRQAPCAAGLAHPSRLSSDDVAKLRALRNAVRALLERRHNASAADIEVINAAAQSGVLVRQLVSDGDDLQVVDRARHGRIDTMLSAIALGVLDAVEHGTFELHRVCDRPGCNLYYFRDHHRRRYCNSRCASADRQARYNARRTKPLRSQTAAR